MKKWLTETFYNCEIILYDTVIVDTCHYVFVQKKKEKPYTAQHLTVNPVLLWILNDDFVSVLAYQLYRNQGPDTGKEDI